MTLEDLRQQLLLAVKGPYVDLGDDTLLEDLIWQAGEHRRQIESAHSWLDDQYVKKDGLTIRGRLERL